MKKHLLLICLFISLESMLVAAETGFTLQFNKRGQNSIGFFIPNNENTVTDTDVPVRFAFADKDESGNAVAEASIGIYWKLFAEGNSAETYKITAHFSSDPDSSGNKSMLIGDASINSSSLNYSVSASSDSDGGTDKILTVNDDFAMLPDADRSMEICSVETDSIGKSGTSILTLEINAPYYDDQSSEEEGVRLGTYSGYIITNLVRE